MFPILFNLAVLSIMRNTFCVTYMSPQARALPARRPRLGRHGHPLPPPQRGRCAPNSCANAGCRTSCAAARPACRPGARQHQGDHAARQQRAGVPGGGAGRRRAHAHRGRRRARGSAAVLCGCYAGDAAFGDRGEWEREVCCPPMGGRQDQTHLLREITISLLSNSAWYVQPIASAY